MYSKRQLDKQSMGNQNTLLATQFFTAARWRFFITGKKAQADESMLIPLLHALAATSQNLGRASCMRAA